MRDYRVQWCVLREKPVNGEEAGFVAGVLHEDAALISQIRKQFQLLKPEMFKKLKRAITGKKSISTPPSRASSTVASPALPPERVYTKRDKRDREVCTIFLLDLSASTDDPIEKPSPIAARRAYVSPRVRDFPARFKTRASMSPLPPSTQQKPQGQAHYRRGKRSAGSDG